MKNRKPRWKHKLGPMWLVDGANQEFVAFSYALMRVFTWKRSFRRMDPAGPEPEAPSGTVPMPAGALDRLAEHVDGIRERLKMSSVSEESSPTPDLVLARKLRELFDAEAKARLETVRWLRKHGCREAVSALEGAYVIEESTFVRSEIVRALRELRTSAVQNAGEVRCTGSSE
jgi:hypothetical protein